MKTCCLNLLVDRELEDNLYAKYIKILTDNPKYSFRKMEIEGISKLIKNFENKMIFDNFYYSYRIPQISKEFDLLKLDENILINIEIKTEFDIDKMKKQLVQNKYYLSPLDQAKKYIFSYCSENNKIYRLEYDNLIECDFGYIDNLLSKISEYHINDIDVMFSPSNFLVSPLNNTDKFLRRQYFLTNQQDDIKLEILNKLKENKQFIHILGKAGTGKTLLAYDIAIELSGKYKVCVVHCGILCNGHYELKKKSANLEILSARQVNAMNFSKYNLIIIDEGQRIFKNTIKHLINEIKINNVSCIIFEDPKQKLSHYESSIDITKYLKENNITISYESKLTTKIRTNPEISNFVQVLFDNKKQITTKYKSIDVIYVHNIDDMIYAKNLYQSKGYKYISYTPSAYIPSNLDVVNSIEFNTHKVIGQEFDNVVMYIDSNFYYNENGELCSRRHPNPNYIYTKLLFQGLTRARYKICLIIWNNARAMEQITKIISKSFDI